MQHAEPLCQSYDPFRLHPDIYSKTFLPGNSHVTMRPMLLPDDLSTINLWFEGHYASKAAAEGLCLTGDFYSTLLRGENTQSLMGFVNGQPAFQADIYQALFAPESLAEICEYSHSDLIMQLMPAPEIIKDAVPSVCTLMACLDCFFSHSAANRVIWMTGLQEQYYRLIAALVDFEELESCDAQYSFHIISRERFTPGFPQMPNVPQMPSTVLDY